MASSLAARVGDPVLWSTSEGKRFSMLGKYVAGFFIISMDGGGRCR
jgi:hypothetical protein